MVKIKQKKTMNLPQLIEWGFNNTNLVKGKLFLTKEHDEYSPYVQFSVDGYGVRTSQSISNDDTFTVEVEEEITEDTVIPELVELYEDTLHSSDGSKVMLVNKNTSISRAKDVDECPTLAFYIINDDLTLDLIWTLEKGLVE